MPDSFSEAFDAPIPETVAGRDVSFPLLDLDDLAKLESFARGRKKQRAVARIPREDHEKIRNVSNWHDDQTVTVRDLADYVASTDGTVETLAMSLVNGGAAKPEAKATAVKLARQKGFVPASDLALRVATLFGQQSPNAPTPADDEIAVPAGD